MDTIEGDRLDQHVHTGIEEIGSDCGVLGVTRGKENGEADAGCIVLRYRDR